MEEDVKWKDDLSKRQEKAVAAMNLISLEEHMGFTAMKTKKKEYLYLVDAVRSIRKDLLKEIVTNTEGENWCISKHLLAATMRMMETGARYIGEDEEKAGGYYKKAFDLYSLFWLLQGPGGQDDGREKPVGKTGKKVPEVE